MNPIRDTIGYADESWNVVTGCRHGCPYCYARRIADKLQKLATLGNDCTQPGGGLHEIRYKGSAAADSYRYGFAPTLHSHRLGEPGRRRKAEVIFVSDMGDLFGDWVPSEWIGQVLQVARDCPRHSFLFLTKHPGRYGEFVLPPNVWAGTTVTGDGDLERVSDLLDAVDGRRVHAWLSYEPALGPLVAAHRSSQAAYEWTVDLAEIAWLVIGGVSPASMPQPRPEWIREAVDAFRSQGRPVFLKANLHPKGLDPAKWAWQGELIQEYPEGLNHHRPEGDGLRLREEKPHAPR